MISLGIETSCDETSVALVKDGREVLSNEVSSSADFHKRHGGVIPEIASRMQLEAISLVVKAAFKDAGIKPREVGLISVTSGPGLLGSLLVGISFAKAMSYSLNLPLIGVNHVHSHFYANFLEHNGIELPFVALVVSGGHTSLFYVKDFDKVSLLGATLDDACGEAFDKVAKILNLGYPGGPLIEKLAFKGNPGSLRFNCSGGSKHPLAFSFSGIKTAVLYYTQNLNRPAGKTRAEDISDVCASFQDSVTDVLVKKAMLACKVKKVKHLVLGGGVVANSVLRKKFADTCRENGIKCFFPSLRLCTDNAAMVAGFGYQLFKKGYKSGLDLGHDLN